MNIQHFIWCDAFLHNCIFVLSYRDKKCIHYIPYVSLYPNKEITFITVWTIWLVCTLQLINLISTISWSDNVFTVKTKYPGSLPCFNTLDKIWTFFWNDACTYFLCLFIEYYFVAWVRSVFFSFVPLCCFVHIRIDYLFLNIGHTGIKRVCLIIQ